MYRFIESIRVKDGIPENIEFHNRRFQLTMREKFKITDKTDLNDFVTVPDVCKSGIFKCRIVYSSKIEKIEFEPYHKREIGTIKIVHDNEIDYSLKYEDKSSLDRLKALYPDYDDILIIKNGFITDTSFSNAVFFNGTEWHTPAEPLLKGTKREKLISEGLIKTNEIHLDHIQRYSKVSFINAMLDLGESETGIQNIS